MEPGKLLSKRITNELQSANSGNKVWAELIKISSRDDIIADLGQGWPDIKAPDIAIDSACKTIRENIRLNQYSPVPGTPNLCHVLSNYYKNRYGKTYEPGKELVVTTSGSEAIFSACMAMVDHGDEVIMFEPYFPWYLPCIRMNGGIPKLVALEPPNFEFNEEKLRQAFSSKTKAIIVNSPHNPTGHVITKRELEIIAELCVQYNVLCISDEVYEDFVFEEDNKHLRIVDMPGMENRTLTISSASKKLCVTGWRVGWLYGPADLITGVRVIHSYISYNAPTPLQEGVADAMGNDPAAFDKFGKDLSNLFKENVGTLMGALEKIGVKAYKPQGGYFLVCDVSGTGMEDVEFCKWLAEEKKVVGVPMSVFYHDTIPKNMVRFALCKSKVLIETAAKAIES